MSVGLSHCARWGLLLVPVRCIRCARWVYSLCPLSLFTVPVGFTSRACLVNYCARSVYWSCPLGYLLCPFGAVLIVGRWVYTLCPLGVLIPFGCTHWARWVYSLRPLGLFTVPVGCTHCARWIYLLCPLPFANCAIHGHPRDVVCSRCDWGVAA